MIDTNLLQPSSDFNELVTSILARFVIGTGSETNSHIHTTLREIAELIGVDYAIVIRTSSDQSSWSVTHEWCAPNAPSEMANFQDVPMGSFAWTERVLLAGEVLQMNRLTDVPAEEEETYRQIEKLGFRSTLQIPIHGPGGNVQGCIVLSSLSHEVHWKDSDVGRLRLVGEAIANAVQRTKVEEELRESEARFRITFEQAPIGILNVTVDGRLIRANQRFCEMLGYSHQEILDRHYSQFTHPDDLDRTTELYHTLLTNQEPTPSIEKRYLRKDGKVVWANFTLSILFSPAIRSDIIVAVIEDITARKQAEENLRKALSEVNELTERLRAENVYLQQEITSSLGFDEIVGESERLRTMLMQVDLVAATTASVLLLGETGTGKELLAHAIHERSPRKKRPLVKVNLAALPASLIESELFGHVKGAFTGAISDKIGRFQLADGGTLFLDEIGELGPELQTKLLRVLQEGEFEKIGSSETLRVDVRIVAATNRDLRQAIKQGAFRPDLFYRLAVFPIDVPPIRHRRDDIPLLTWHFISKKQARLGKSIQSVPSNVMQSLVDYDWPGNVRELENVIERAMILSSGGILSLPDSLQPADDRKPTNVLSANRNEMDRALIISALDACRWKIKGTGNAAERLGLNPSTLRYRMKALGIERTKPDNHSSAGSKELRNK